MPALYHMQTNRLHYNTLPTLIISHVKLNETSQVCKIDIDLHCTSCLKKRLYIGTV